MNNKRQERVNTMARLNRHLRILKQNVTFESKAFRNWKISNWLIFCLIFIVFIFPIYPSISNIVYTNTETEFYRWNIDESSILSSYYNDSSDVRVEHIDSYISQNMILDDSRDLTWVNEIVNYEVQLWDSIASIAEKFWVSRNTVLRANNMDYARSLVVWENIRVPTVTWYLYKVKSGDTLEKIAKEYSITAEAISNHNNVTNSTLLAWAELLLPWASKPQPKPVVTAKPVATTTNNSKKTNTSSNSWSGWASSYTTSSWGYQLVRRAPKWKFVRWNCTRYVAQYKNVNWWWNANQWMRNAAAKWHSIWYTPTPWAIVQFSGRWYNPTYWHVWIVINVTSTHIIVSDMNYRALNEVTVRQVPINDASIDWYIYVD